MPKEQVDWQAIGACSRLEREDPELREAFYADTTAERAPARKLCGKCPVRLNCLTAALERGETWGVWGGCDEVDLRRALWTDTSGTNRERLRFPRCPACRARSENLFIQSLCGLYEGSEVTEVVECGSCHFSWDAPTSVEAVKRFWESQPAAAKVVPIKRVAKVRVARGRIPSDRPSRSRKPVQLQGPMAVPEQSVRALVASSGPKATR